jgi:5'-phosphate synthase pdxT subunit
MKVGVLALQGAFLEHLNMIEQCGQEGIPVKTRAELNKISCLIIPGGESTAIGKLMNKSQLDEEIIKLYNRTNIPIFGTCAGMILLAKKIEGKEQSTLGLIDITVQRNAFGRQIESFEAELDITGITPPSFRGIFIRAPYITEAGESVQKLCYFNQNIVLAQDGNILVSSFHPELGNDLRIHQYFLKINNKN